MGAVKKIGMAVSSLSLKEVPKRCGWLLVGLFLLAGCYSIPPAPEFTGDTGNGGSDTGTTTTGTGGPSDGDTDIDADTDTDVDTDGDTDTDADGDTDTSTGPDPGTGQDTDTAVATDTGGPSCADGVSCYDPPRTCEGDYGIVVYETPGTCVDGPNGGECRYKAMDSEVCQSGPCDAGVCVDSPCQGIVCADPPLPECASDTTIRFWSGNTSYADGCTCNYEKYVRPCAGDHRCINGVGGKGAYCEAEGTGYYICSFPMANYCYGNELVRFESKPTVVDEGGYCDNRMKTSSLCPQGQTCFEGHCVDDDAQ